MKKILTGMMIVTMLLSSTLAFAAPITSWAQTTVDDFNAGTVSNVQVINTTAGGEMTLVNSSAFNISYLSSNFTPVTFSGVEYIYAGGYGPFVYRTSDGGANWSPAGNGLVNPVIDLEVANFSGATYLYAVIFRADSNGYDVGVYRTSDGVNWLPAEAGLPLNNYTDVGALGSANFSGVDYLYITIGYEKMVYRTSDGINWTSADAGLPSFAKFGNFANANFSGVDYLYIAEHNIASVNPPKIYRTSDGINWSSANAGIPIWLMLSPYAMAAANLSGTNYLYVAGPQEVGNPTCRLGAYRTSDGVNWEDVSSGLPVPLCNGGRVVLTTVNKSGVNYLYVGGQVGQWNDLSTFVYRTDGTQWTWAGSGLPFKAPFTPSVAMIDTDTGLYFGLNVSGNFVAAYRTLDGINWFSPSYYFNGEFVSSVIEAGPVNEIRWTEDLPAGTDVTFQTRTSKKGTVWSDWSSPVTNSTGSPITSPAGQYVQYKAFFSTTNISNSPVIKDVTILK